MFDHPSNFRNRELSWMEFNQRILGEARDKQNPLFERMKFLSITASNLDEFFMVRIASLKDMVNAGYLKKDISWYKFNNSLLIYNLKTEQWEIPSPENALLARAGAQVALRGHTLYYIGGELKPGLRSPSIVKVDLR